MKEPVTRIMVVALNGRSIEPSWDTGEDVPGHYVDGVVNREGEMVNPVCIVQQLKVFKFASIGGGYMQTTVTSRRSMLRLLGEFLQF